MKYLFVLCLFLSGCGFSGDYHGCVSHCEVRCANETESVFALQACYNNCTVKCDYLKEPEHE